MELDYDFHETHPDGPAGEFVRAALAEVGQDRLLPVIRVNRVGDPIFHGKRLDPLPTVAECDAVIQAFDLWHGPGPTEVREDCWWDGRTEGDAERWADTFGSW